MKPLSIAKYLIKFFEFIVFFSLFLTIGMCDIFPSKTLEVFYCVLFTFGCIIWLVRIVVQIIESAK